VSDLQSRGRGFGHYRMVATLVLGRVSYCTQTDKPYRYISNAKVNSAFYSCGIGKSISACLARVKAGQFYLCQVAGEINPIWQVVTLHSSLTTVLNLPFISFLLSL